MMATWTWFALAVVLVGIELATGTFYVLMVAMGLAAGGVATWLGASATTQISLAAVLALLATWALHQSRYGQFAKRQASTDVNVNLDIGQTIDVAAWDGNGHARVKYRGAEWDVRMQAGEPLNTGRLIIREVQGSTLVLSAH